MTLMDGKKCRDELIEKYKKIIESENLKIRLDIILVGNDPASEIYVRNKIKYTNLVGIEAKLHRLEETVSENEVIELIKSLNDDPKTTGIILQSPTPNMDFDQIVEYIKPEKDVDGLVSTNVINLYHNKKTILPCTVKGILELLKYYNIDPSGKRVTLIGRGDIVGKPLSLALQNAHATVTVCDEFTLDKSLYTKNAEIIISAVGKKDLIKEEDVSDGFIGLDVGITREQGKIYGDFDFENTSKHAAFMTPVPGGVGPMTIAMIISNLIDMKRTDQNG